MRRLLLVTLVCLVPTSAYADACSWLEGWNIEMEAANKSLSPSTRAFMETENPAVNDMVDIPTGMLSDWWIVGWLCDAPDLERPARDKDDGYQK